ncbi:MAG: PhoH family protein [Bacteroidetes bacterium]|nr:PhoH family protein [Bacteroidota bacterium]MBR3091313.1 PhoH family protein [Bacteroidota bacterium]
MEIVESKISLSDSHLVDIFNNNTDYILLLEKRFSVIINLRGDTLILKGGMREISIIEKIISECEYMLQKKNIFSKNDFITVINLFDIKSKTLNNVDGVVNNIVYNGYKNGAVITRNAKQEEYVQTVKDNDLVFSVGPAGTGKTYLAVAMALAALRDEKIQRIIVTRPAVEAGESLGFLPGELKDKIEPYLRPINDAMFSMLSPDVLHTFTEKQLVEITPLAYMRGRTLDNAFIILDEAQNATITQMKMFLTRLGNNSKAIVTGDVTQIDLKEKNQSGLVHAMKILKNIKGIGFVTFDKKDIVRHRLVAKIIEAYDKENKKINKNISNS